MMEPLSRTPVRNGAVYCSPACGRNCGFHEYEKAKDEADKLARRLGTAWKPVVWENLGWHWKAVHKGLKVHPGVTSRDFVAFLGDDERSGGYWSERGTTPRGAVKNVLRTVREKRDWIDNVLHKVRGAL